MLMISILILIVVIDDKSSGKGEVHIEPGDSYIYFRDCDTEIYGWDSYNTTYFFLPSFAGNASLDYSHTQLKMYDEDGELLEHPETGKVLNVLIEKESGEKIPYHVAFYCSENLYTIQLELENGTIWDIDHDVYTPTKIRVISPGGTVEYEEDEARIKGRGNTSWAFSMKKPYEIKLTKETALAGMKASHKWELLSNQLDKTRMLNKIAFDTAKKSAWSTLSSQIGSISMWTENMRETICCVMSHI